VWDNDTAQKDRQREAACWSKDRLLYTHYGTDSGQCVLNTLTVIRNVTIHVCIECVFNSLYFLCLLYLCQVLSDFANV